MCEQAARYCRAGVHRLLRKPAPALRGLDGLLRWVGARMSDKGVADRELLTSGASAQRKGTSVILDVSDPEVPRLGVGHPLSAGPTSPRECTGIPAALLLHPAPPDRRGIGVISWSCIPLHGSCIRDWLRMGAARFLPCPPRGR